MFRYLFVLGWLFLFLGHSFSQNIHVGLFPNNKLKRVKFANATTSFHLIADSTYIGTIDHFGFFEAIALPSKKVEVIFQGQRYAGFETIKLVAMEFNKSIEFTGIVPVLKSRAFEGDFEISNAANFLKIVNSIDLDTYLEGVVESESGTAQKLEYYKVQSIISRTFALKAWNKHAKDGYNLCNQVHCQAYLHKRNGSNLIDSAVALTKNIILTMNDTLLAPTFFSANCGGQTCNPVQVWNEEIQGLESFKDTFCIYSQQARWTKKISKAEWTQFLLGKYQYPIDDSLSQQCLYQWSSECRTAFLIHPGYGMPMRDIREHFGLKSSFFNVKQSGEEIVLEGKGYGHGVGLCQEGAMRMSKLGYSYLQILGYYFPSYQVKIRD